jgi:hypothetical protein
MGNTHATRVAHRHWLCSNYGLLLTAVASPLAQEIQCSHAATPPEQTKSIHRMGIASYRIDERVRQLAFASDVTPVRRGSSPFQWTMTQYVPAPIHGLPSQSSQLCPNIWCVFIAGRL